MTNAQLTGMLPVLVYSMLLRLFPEPCQQKVIDTVPGTKL